MAEVPTAPADSTPVVIPTPYDPADPRRTQYSPEIAAAVEQLYGEGWKLTEIAAMAGMPAYGTLCRWIKDSTKFADALEGARRIRALNFEERALAIADAQSIDKDDVPGERLKFDVLKWGAESNDPARFGKKVTVGGDASRPIVFKLVTGVPEPEGHQRVIELNADGTQRNTPRGESSSAEERGGSTPPEAAGAIPASPALLPAGVSSG